MFKLKVISGIHVERGTVHKEGSVFECEKDLSKIFAGKFAVAKPAAAPVPPPPAPEEEEEDETPVAPVKPTPPPAKAEPKPKPAVAKKAIARR